MRRLLLATGLILSLSGCVITHTAVSNPVQGLSTVAVVPFFNLSSERTVDGRLFAETYQSELQKVPGFQVLPVGVVETAMKQYRLDMNRPDDVIKLAEYLNVDAVVIGAVTNYEPYYPPQIGMQVSWYSPYRWEFFPGVPNDIYARRQLKYGHREFDCENPEHIGEESGVERFKRLFRILDWKGQRVVDEIRAQSNDSESTFSSSNMGHRNGLMLPDSTPLGRSTVLSSDEQYIPSQIRRQPTPGPRFGSPTATTAWSKLQNELHAVRSQQTTPIVELTPQQRLQLRRQSLLGETTGAGLTTGLGQTAMSPPRGNPGRRDIRFDNNYPPQQPLVRQGNNSPVGTWSMPQFVAERPTVGNNTGGSVVNSNYTVQGQRRPGANLRLVQQQTPAQQQTPNQQSATDSASEIVPDIFANSSRVNLNQSPEIAPDPDDESWFREEAPQPPATEPAVSEFGIDPPFAADNEPLDIKPVVPPAPGERPATPNQQTLPPQLPPVPPVPQGNPNTENPNLDYPEYDEAMPEKQPMPQTQHGQQQGNQPSNSPQLPPSQQPSGNQPLVMPPQELLMDKTPAELWAPKDEQPNDIDEDIMSHKEYPPELSPFEPLMSYTRVFDGADGDLQATLRDYLELRGDERGGDWQGYLQRSEDYIRFATHRMIVEMLTLHGGEGKQRIILTRRKYK